MKRTDLTPGFLRRTRFRLAAAVAIGLALGGCQADELGYGPKHLREVSAATKAKMTELDMAETSPVLMRIFKEENKFEVWKKDRTGRYQLLKSYDICKWSGNLGPKIKEGDRQAPEGYYTITPALMNPNSQYYLAFNTGFPNAFDRSHGRTGSALMVHGACSSRGCYAMTDEQIQEIYALARDAFRGGQRAFQLQAYPFRLTAENMAKHWNSPNMPFWKMLKEGYDTFELTRQEPKVDVCGRKYVFNAGTKAPLSPVEPCPELQQPEELRLALAKKAAEDEQKAIVIAARLDSERKIQEEKEILLAQKKEEIRLAALERAQRAQENPGVLVSLFGETTAPTASAPTAPASATATPPAETAVAAAAVKTGPGGEPLPRPDPRGPATALAMAPVEASQAASNRSIFGRLFSFGEDELPAPAEATASAAPAAGSVPATAAASATVVEAPATTASVTPAPSAGPSAPTGQATTAVSAAGKTDLPAAPAPALMASGAGPAATPAEQEAGGFFAPLRRWF